MTGLTAVMGHSDAEPRVTSAALTDAMSGVAAAAAVLTAIERRRRTEQGAFIDLSQHEVGVAFLGEWFIERQLRGEEPPRLGNAHAEYAPHGVYRCLGDDDWIALAARTEAEWQALCALTSCGWERDARFATADGRRQHTAELDVQIEAWTSMQEKRALMEALQARGVPAGAVLSPPEWLEDPHLVERGYFAELDHAETGRGRSDGSPLRFDGERAYEAWRAAPLLGQHNTEVLTNLLGLTPQEVEALEREGVLADRPPGAVVA
jgi:crotonobetainyl-CoA:carnitine CoA-transferase CaiB-like acyl-CoA transferase